MAIFAMVLPLWLLACGGTSDENLPTIGTVIQHSTASEAKCERYEQGGICGEQGHWIIEIQGERFANPDKMNELIKKEADAERTDKRQPFLSQRKMLIRAEPSSPWQSCQSVIRSCSKSGIYKIELISGKPGEKKESVEFWFNTYEGPRARAPLFIRLFVRWDSAHRVIKRKIDARDYVSDDPSQGDQELLRVMGTIAKEQKAEKSDFIISIDAGPDVSFEAVVRIIRLFRENEFDWVQCATPVGPITSEPEKSKK